MTDTVPVALVASDFLPASTRAALLSDALTMEKDFVSATVYGQSTDSVDHDKRRCRKLPTHGSTLIEPFLEAFSRRIDDFFVSVGMVRRPVARLETEIAAYNDGGLFHEHVDTLTGSLRSKQGLCRVRALSAVYYFHDEPRRFQGGELRIWSFGNGPERKFRDIEPAGNTLVVFPSFVPHEVLRVDCGSHEFKDSRFAVNCWAQCEI